VELSIYSNWNNLSILEFRYFLFFKGFGVLLVLRVFRSKIAFGFLMKSNTVAMSKQINGAILAVGPGSMAV
jgi:hypothetical protein